MQFGEATNTPGQLSLDMMHFPFLSHLWYARVTAHAAFGIICKCCGIHSAPGALPAYAPFIHSYTLM